MRDMLRFLLTRPIAFHPAISRLTGSVTAGLLLCQLLYWSDRSSHKDGWIYKTADEWTGETTLSRDELRTARKRLTSLSLVEEERASKIFPEFNKFDRQLCYRVDYARLYESLEQLLEGENCRETPVVDERREIPNRGAESPKSRKVKCQVDGASPDVHSTESSSESSQKEEEQAPAATVDKLRKLGVILANKEDEENAIRLVRGLEGRYDLLAEAVSIVRGRREKNRPYLSSVGREAHTLLAAEITAKRLESSAANLMRVG